MLKTLIEIWRSRKAERELYSQFVEMLEMSWELFEMVMEVLSGRVEPDSVQDDVLLRDIEINRKERAIRRQVVEHMILNPTQNVSASLVLMSVVKDAERVGDYCKNLIEVAQMLQVPYCNLSHCQEVVDIGNHVTRIFKTSIRAFADEDEDLAREVIEDEALMNRRCDKLIELLARSELSANEAVCTALWVRFLKRVEAHLSNICSSVVLPVHRIDHRLSYDRAKHSAASALAPINEK